MSNLMLQKLPFLFPVFFMVMWLLVTSLLSLLSGWFRLAARYPDRDETAILRLTGLSGSMGVAVSMSSILRLSVCPSGLRVGMMRLFGPFCRDFLVPWDELTIRRTRILFWAGAELRFGAGPVGKLRISATIANRLARAAGGHWPETTPIPPEAPGSLARRLLGQWALMTAGAALFFTVGPRLADPHHAGPPVIIAILFPAIVFALAMLWRWFRERG